jgi:hypothetical protein
MKEEQMKIRLTVIIVLVALLIPISSNAKDFENFIEIKGQASTIVMPDVAHCFLIVTGEGETYESSNKSANDKLSQLTEVLKITLHEVPQFTILKVEDKPKTRPSDQPYEKEFFVEMAKAMKGENSFCSKRMEVVVTCRDIINI